MMETAPPILAPGAAQHIGTWPDKTVLEVAAAVCRERAREAPRLHRDRVTAARESSQLMEIALRIDSIVASMPRQQ